jgi:hypothetical protein
MVLAIQPQGTHHRSTKTLRRRPLSSTSAFHSTPLVDSRVEEEGDFGHVHVIGGAANVAEQEVRGGGADEAACRLAEAEGEAVRGGWRVWWVAVNGHAIRRW